MGSESSKNLEKVDIKLFIWNGGNGDVGHVSMYIVESYLYISFWPEIRAKAGKSVRSITNSHDEDEGMMGRPADHVHEANIDLDVSAMEKCWSKAKDENYSFLGNNCSDAVMKVLESGNDDFVLIPEAFPSTREPNPNWTQRDYIIWIREKLINFRLQGVHYSMNR